MRGRGRWVAGAVGVAAVLGLTAVRTTRAGDDAREGRRGEHDDRGGLDLRALQGLRIAPVKLDVDHRSRRQVATS